MSQGRHCPQNLLAAVEPLHMGDPLAYVGHCLTDIVIALDDIARDQRAILDELRQREDLESRLTYLEHVVHGALFEGDTDEPSPF